MNDLSYIDKYSDIAILQHIGAFIRARRIAQNLTQDELAHKAAISRSTLSLIERGENVSLMTLLKILRILNALYVLEHFRVLPQPSPLLLAKEEEKRRSRASKKNSDNPKENQGW